MITHEHTPLIAHTADDIVTSESGLYGSDQGIPIANEYRYYTPSGGTDTAGSFAYWSGSDRRLRHRRTARRSATRPRP